MLERLKVPPPEKLKIVFPPPFKVRRAPGAFKVRLTPLFLTTEG
jgi:hypothetical protein